MLVACVLLCAAGALGFNVDIPSRVVYRGYNNSMFGFTVQAHVDGDQKMILVGAPEADSSYLTSLRRPGVVFRCAPGQRGYERGTPLDMCREMRFDQKPGNNVDKSRNPIDQKSNQWFGATLSSTGRNGPIVACAPRYVSFVNAKLQHRDPVGSCFVAPSSNADPREINEYSPCRTHFPSVDEASHGHRKTGICQAGFSAAISRDGQRMFMGAPGSFYWQGRTISIDPSHQFNSHYMKIPEEGQVYSQSTSSRPVLIATPEGSPKYDDQYMGYSMTVGDFSGQGEQGVAVAVPRGADLRGLVVLYTWELQNIKNITGSQIGAYFGYSLASGDIDGDGTDDIIVGAPMFTKPKTDGFEHGRIYVIYQGRDRSFMRSDARTGEVSRGRFGLAVTSLGDINYDGFGDIAVGAPYGGENGRGVVYIYQGSELGIQKKYSQAITAEEISPSLRTFGFSLSGGVDLDNNNYTDLAVGAYKSDSVVFLKSRPVVKVMAEVRFLGDTKLISLTDKRCAMNGTQASCSELMYCLRYDGINVDRQIKFEVSLDLDSRQTTTKRILTERRESVYRTNIMLEQGRQKCQRLTVYLDEEIRDKLTPIEVKMTYNLVSQPTGNIVPPVLDQTQSISAGDSLNIQKNCGPDNVCIPNLSMEASTNVNDYVLGSGDYIVIDVKVVNSGEDAFEAAYYLKIPPGVTYAKMERISKDNTNVYCSISHKDVNGTSALKCDMGNPLSYNEEVHFKVSLEVDATASNIQFYMEANSTNPEKPTTSFDNSKTITVSVLVKAMLTVYGTSDPPELHYNASQYDPSKATITDESQLGPQLIHKYNIKNEGPFTADEAEFYIMWPYQTLTGENLMYMLVQPQPLGNVRCEVARNVNPENLYVQNPYAFLLTQQKKDMLSSEEFASLYAEYFESNSRDWLDQKYYVDQTIGQSGGQVSSQGSQFGSNQGSSFHTSSSQSGSGWQSSSGQSSHASGGMTGGGYREENARGGGLTREEQESIRRQLAAAAQSGFLSNGAQQSSGGYHGGLANEGLRPGYSVIREKNKTIVYDEHHNIISETETSTEYDSLAQGQAGGSLYVNRNGGSQYGHSSQGSQSHTSSSQGYSGGSQQSFASGSQSSYAGSQRNYASGSQRNYASGSQSSYARAGAGGYQDSRGFVLTDLPTTETVNRDIMNADSSRFRGGVTSVGDADDDLTGVFADAARGKNGDFQYGMVHVGDEDQRRSDSTRRRRQASVDGQLVLLLDKCNEKYKCSAVRCTTGRLLKGQEVWVALRTRLNATVLNEISKDRAVKLSSLATAHVTRLPGLGRPARTIWHTAEAQTLVSGQLAAAEGGSVPLWVVVLAAVVGALLLLLLIFALYKCGFFKRNRPSDHTERQPLNGRDEHL